MFDYLIGLLFLLVFILYCYLFGCAIKKEPGNIPKKIIIGYISYSFLTATFLIPIQLLNFAWVFSVYSICFIWCFTIIFIIYRFKKNSIQLLNVSISNLVKKYYFLIFITIMLFIIFLFQVDLIWLNNHLDDGYYLVKVATLPYLKSPFLTDYSTGIIHTSEGVNSYLFSSYELELSVYRFILQIDPVIFCRAIINILNYFLLTCTVYSVARDIFYILEDKFDFKKCYIIQFTSIIILLFSFNYIFMRDSGFLLVQDSWQFNSAMWYGSSIVRLMGMMWLLLPLFNIEKITIKEFVKIIIISFVLVSKSSIAVPIILISGFSFLISFLLTYINKYCVISGVALLILLYVVGYFLPNKETTNNLLLSILQQNEYSIILMVTIVIYICALIFMKNRKINRIIIFMIIIPLLMFLPELNDFFEMYSMYSFVAARVETNYIYTFIIIGTIFIFCFLYKLQSIYLYRRRIGIIFVLLSLLVMNFSILSTVYSGSRVEQTIKIMVDNSGLIPQRTKLLSKFLGTENRKLYTISPDWVNEQGYNHGVSVMLRLYAPNVISVSATGRYKPDDNSIYSTFAPTGQDVYNKFQSVPSDENFMQLSEVIDTYSINCIVFQNECFEPYAASLKFDLKGTILGYYVYVKNY